MVEVFVRGGEKVGRKCGVSKEGREELNPFIVFPSLHRPIFNICPSSHFLPFTLLGRLILRVGCLSPPVCSYPFDHLLLLLLHCHRHCRRLIFRVSQYKLFLSFYLLSQSSPLVIPPPLWLFLSLPSVLTQQQTPPPFIIQVISSLFSANLSLPHPLSSSNSLCLSVSPPSSLQH